MSSTRTTRIPDRWVSGGAVTQDGKLPLYTCNTCHAEVVWATSNRTGGKYLVTVRRGQSDARYYAKRDAHRCEAKVADEAKWKMRTNGPVATRIIRESIQAGIVDDHAIQAEIDRRLDDELDLEVARRLAAKAAE